MIGFEPGTNPLSLYDELRTLAAPYTTFFSGGKFADRSQAMDQNLQDIIRDQIATTGKGSGIIGYSDFDKSQTPGTEFPNMNTMMADLAKGKISPAEFANLTTLGRLNYDVDPNTGKVNFGSNVYDFRPEVADQGGVFGVFAKMANERGREINPNITVPVDELRGFGRNFSEFGDPDSFRSRMSNNRFDELPSTRQTSSPRAAGAEDIKEEGIFSLGDILADLGRKGVEGFKDVAGRSIASQALGGAGGMIFGPMGALVGGLAGLFKGGDMFKQSYDPFYKQFADPSRGGVGFKDKYGINTISAFGDYGKYALDKAYGINALSGDKGDFYRDVVAKKNAAMTDANVGFGDSGDASDGGANAGTSNAGSGSSDDGFI